MASTPPSSTPGEFTPKQLKELQKSQKRENYLARIKEANNIRYQNECANLDILVPTPPERKNAVILHENNRPYLTRDSFVKVIQNTTAGNNRPAGFGYISECNGVGGAAFYSVKYTPAHDGGRIHKKIPLSDLTPCTPFDNFPAESIKRTRKICLAS